jgi:hypothetical protein
MVGDHMGIPRTVVFTNHTLRIFGSEIGHLSIVWQVYFCAWAGRRVMSASEIWTARKCARWAASHGACYCGDSEVGAGTMEN